MGRHVIPAAEEYIDRKIPVLDCGFVALVDYMGGDAAIAEAARTSVAGEGVKATSDDRGLIRRLMSDNHTSPFEMVELKFVASMPIFVARQWIRHRTANVNEMSGRYSELPELTYVPDPVHVGFQDPKNKQGREGVVPESVTRAFCEAARSASQGAFDLYHAFLGKGDKDAQSVFDCPDFEVVKEGGGIARELARINLPLSTYTQWYWKIDLHNLLHFLELRLDEHAQWEIRQYAEVMAAIVRALCPIVWEAFEDYRLKAVRFSAPEIEALGLLVVDFGRAGLRQDAQDDANGLLAKLSSRELDAFAGKMVRLVQTAHRKPMTKRELDAFAVKLIKLGFNSFVRGKDLP